MVLLILVLGLILVGCSTSKRYEISGRITDENDVGMGQVKISITGGTNATATTNGEGRYTVSELKGTINVTPIKKGWGFKPSTKKISSASNDVNFQGIEGIYIEDENLEQAIRKELNILTGIILEEDAENLIELTASNKGIKSIEGLENFRNLVDLILASNEVSNINPLRWLNSLLSLDLRDNGIENISTLSYLESLGWLGLRENNIDDITPLASMTELNWLDLWDNNVSDLTPLSGLVKLRNLFLSNNQISDISVLENLPTLFAIYLDGNQITDISVLEGLMDLRHLRIKNNPLDMEDPETIRILNVLSERGVNMDIEW